MNRSTDPFPSGRLTSQGLDAGDLELFLEAGIELALVVVAERGLGGDTDFENASGGPDALPEALDGVESRSAPCRVGYTIARTVVPDHRPTLLALAE